MTSDSRFVLRNMREPNRPSSNLVGVASSPNPPRLQETGRENFPASNAPTLNGSEGGVCEVSDAPRTQSARASSDRLRVGVVGCGLMGSGIAEVCARSQLDVIVVESSAAAVSAGSTRIARSVQRAVDRGQIPSAGEVLSYITICDDLGSLEDRTIVIEAIAEDEAAKVALFRNLDGIIQDDSAILASNTSSIPIMKLAGATRRPSHVMGIHFFNPVPVLSLVELIPSLFTQEEVVSRARAFVEVEVGKHAIRCQDRAGLVVNALLIPFILSAIRMLESGFATAADIDRGMVLGCAHPQGPLSLADLVGLDTTKSVADSLWEEFKEPLFACPPLLARMVDAGFLGRKSGRGFYTYDSNIGA